MTRLMMVGHLCQSRRAVDLSRGTPDGIIVAVDDWPSGTTRCVWLIIVSSHGYDLWCYNGVASSAVDCVGRCQRPWRSQEVYITPAFQYLHLVESKWSVASWNHVDYLSAIHDCQMSNTCNMAVDFMFQDLTAHGCEWQWPVVKFALVCGGLKKQCHCCC